MTPDTIRLRRRGWSMLSTLAVACSLGVLLAACDHRAMPLARSVNVGLMKPADTTALESAIERSLAARHWTVKEHTGQKYVAELAEKGHSATVAVVYDAQSARVDYVDSSGLLYEKSPQGETIHRSYNTWVKNLANDIKTNAAQAAPAAASR